MNRDRDALAIRQPRVAFKFDGSTVDDTSFSEHEKAAHGWLTQSEAATRLEISPMSMTRLVQAGLVPADQPHSHLPSIIQDEALSAPEVQRAVNDLKSSKNRPLPQDPTQLSLFTTTKP